MADPVLHGLGVPVPGLSPPVRKRHDAHFGVVVREDNAVGETLEYRTPVISIADPAGQLVRCRLATSYVFVTSRRWPEMERRVDKRNSEQKWAEVRALDADDLAA